MTPVFTFSATPQFWAVNSVLVFVICVILAGVLIPKILLISFRKKLFDVPDERKIHHAAIPCLGGIAFNPVVIFSIASLLGVCRLLGYDDVLYEVVSEGLMLTFGFCAVMVLYLVGIADDLIGIRYRSKFVAQIACGLMVIAGGLWIDNLHGLLLIYNIPELIGWPLTVFAVVFIINAINLIDGIDGLASGLCGVAMLFYGIILFVAHEYICSMLAFATLGVLVPFFYYNVFGNVKRGRKIFMGDTGSMTVGMMLCILSLKVCRCFTDDASADAPNPFVLAYSPLIIPCFDVVRVYMHRVRNGRNPFMPDKSHIHHKLLAIGMPQRAAMVTIVSVAVVFTLFNILLSTCISVTLLLIVDVLIYTAANIRLTRRIRQVKKEL